MMESTKIPMRYFATNNYGKCETKQSETSSVMIEMYTIVKQHATPFTPLFTVNYVTVNERLCVSVLYYTGRTSKKEAKQFANKLKNLILYFSQ